MELDNTLGKQHPPRLAKSFKNLLEERIKKNKTDKKSKSDDEDEDLENQSSLIGEIINQPDRNLTGVRQLI